VYEYTLNTANDPFTTTFSDQATASDIGLPGADYAHTFMNIYSPADQAVLLNRWTTGSGLAFTMGRWEMSNFPFTLANATWTGVPAVWGTVEAQKVSRNGIPLLDRTRNRLYVSSQASGKVLTFDWDDGGFVGEWAYDDVWGTTSPFRFLGVQDSTGYVLGGSNHTDGGDGAMFLWNPSNANSWTKADPAAVVDNSTTSALYNRCRIAAYDRTPGHLRDVYGRLYPLQRQQVDGMGFAATDMLGVEFLPQNYGYTYSTQVLRRHGIASLPTHDFQQYHISRISNYGRTGFGHRGVNLCSPILIDGNWWFVCGSSGGIDHFDEQPTGGPSAAGVSAFHVDVGEIIAELPSSAGQPKNLWFEIASGQVDGEGCTHPGKWQASVRINGGSWSDARAGSTELNQLDSVVNGKSAWPTWSLTDTVELRLNCTTGVLHNYEDVQGNPGDLTTPRLPILNIGPPRNVRPKLQIEAVVVEEGFGVF
jgi:hypothetical protein